MAQRILRPMGYGDILDEMFDLYKNNFLLFAGIAGLVYIPLYLIIFSLGPVVQAVGSILALPLNYVVMAAAIWAISQKYLGNEVTILESYGSIRKRSIPFIMTMLVSTIFMGLGFLLIIPGVILAFRYAFISGVFVVEGKAGKEARVRSAQLAAGETNRIFVLSLLAGILVVIISGIFTWPAAALSVFLAGGREAAGETGPLMGLAQGVATALATPVQLITFVLLYYDVRVRKEGFDLELLAASLGEKPAAEPAQSEQAPV